ncbi:cation/H(+) antiporter 14-like [Amaranthus tricolor]|uniref:cation/H(+) antiporter 14-like n=1 Tax=Amaranthus tricolor TaxID=29722 RepID=UPI0025885E46|nr:cation/H(+) antiporter 14-like [Amaranthus tricolor]
MTARTSTYDPAHVWSEGTWNGTNMLCQERPFFLGSQNVWSDPFYPHSSESSTCFLLICLVVIVVTVTSVFLRPLGLPTMSKMFGGFFVIGMLFSKSERISSLLHPTVYYIFKTFSMLGFVFYTFIFGVETNMGALRKIGKKAVTISVVGFISSLALGYLSYNMLGLQDPSGGLPRYIIANALTYFMVTCSHVNELGISNSDIARLAGAISLVVDIFGMFATILIFNVFLPVRQGDYMYPFWILGVYFIMFFICRPLIILIVSYTPEGKRMKDTHFLAIILIILLLGLITIQADQHLAVLLMSLFLPEEPLTTILGERLDVLNNTLFLPIFCAMHGFQTDFNALNKRSILVELHVFFGALGKFLGTFLSSFLFGVPIWSAITLGILMSSKGFLDIVLIGTFIDMEVMTPEDYTIIGVHILFYTGLLLPLVRFMYVPSREYSTILRQGVLASADTGTLQALICIHREENIPGFLRLLEAFNPTYQKPIPVVALQLNQLTGRVSLPILAPFHEVQSSAAFRSNLGRCNRIISSLLSIERRTNGAARLQHYISISPYTTMHNDINSLAHERNVNLLILPFHTQWNAEGEVEHTSQSIRDVNKMVLEKAPCSAGLLIDKGDKDVTMFGNMKYRVGVFFIGGVDDHEALAYATLFATHPRIQITVIWLKSRMTESNTHRFDDYAVIQEFYNRLQANERIFLQEVLVSDGAETTNAIMQVKKDFDLAVVGRYHEPGCTPLFGLSNRWCEYPELGILGDMIVTPEFEFSVLVVQEEPHQATGFDELIDDFIM